MSDDINQPEHYNQGDVECIQALEAASTTEEFLGHLRLCAIKYLWRCNYKDSPEKNIKKAVWYLNRYLSKVEVSEAVPVPVARKTPYCGIKDCGMHMS